MCDFYCIFQEIANLICFFDIFARDLNLNFEDGQLRAPDDARRSSMRLSVRNIQNVNLDKLNTTNSKLQNSSTHIDIDSL